MASVFIYVLIDPRTSEVRYVGQTKDVQKRKHYHRSLSGHPKGTARYRWIVELREQNIFPEFKVVEECTEANWQERERFWIWRYGGIRKLLNARHGGAFHKPASAEIYAVMADKARGKKRPEMSDKLRHAWQTVRKGEKRTPEQIEKIRQAQLVQFADPITRERHRQGVLKWYAEASDELRSRCADAGRAELRKHHTSEKQSARSKAHWDSMSAQERERFVQLRAKASREKQTKEERQQNTRKYWEHMTAEEKEIKLSKLHDGLKARWVRYREAKIVP